VLQLHGSTVRIRILLLLILQLHRAQCKERLNHVSRTDGNKHPKQLLEYRPNGRRRYGLLDGYSHEAKTGTLLANLRDQKKKKKFVIQLP
jgi:hypothetical protein